MRYSRKDYARDAAYLVDLVAYVKAHHVKLVELRGEQILADLSLDYNTQDFEAAAAVVERYREAVQRGETKGLPWQDLLREARFAAEALYRYLHELAVARRFMTNDRFVASVHDNRAGLMARREARRRVSGEPPRPVPPPHPSGPQDPEKLIEVLALRHEGKEVYTIARKVGLSERTVYRYLERYDPGYVRKRPARTPLPERKRRRPSERG